MEICLTFVNSNFGTKTSGSINDITASGVHFVGNAVTGKPNDQSGAGTGGMVISAYAGVDNYVYLYIKNTSATSGVVWVHRKAGGTDYGWIQLI